jgi:hypothetical protein
VLINRLHYALPGWEDAEGRRDAQERFYESAQERFYESAQAREFADRVEFVHLDFDDVGPSRGRAEKEWPQRHRPLGTS